MNGLVLTVSQINTYIKSLIDGDKNLNPVFVRGEISNLNKHYSGHYYFSLKDNGGVIRSVMFKSAVARLKFSPESGMSVIIRGRISVFERDGQYQLYAEEMQPDGTGALYLAYEQLKERLSKEGLFDVSRKKPLPKYPSKIGVITSPTGAAVRDILNILGRRYPLAEIMFHPALVQGEEAAATLCNAVKYMNDNSICDVIIIGRGGGSIEDLWAFNDETLARVIADSHIPVISAVGHETDFTICDFAADMRAPTPSAAAELAAPDMNELAVTVKKLEGQVSTNYLKGIEKKKMKLDWLKSRRCFSQPESITERKAEILGYDEKQLISAYNLMLRMNSECFAKNVSKLDALSPLKVLSRGYCIAQRQGDTIKSAAQIAKQDEIKLSFADGEAICIAQETRLY